MSGNSFGKLFKITSCGESHGGAIAVIVDGCPSNLEISALDIQKELDRRKPGQSDLTSPRKEADKINIFSGVFEGRTTGAPILLLAYNNDMRPEDYAELKDIFRPSHADYTYAMKYNIRDFRGSGRASARETLARVAAGAIAKKYLKQELGVEIISYVSQVGSIIAQIDHETVSIEQIEQNKIRCPEVSAAKKMIALIEKLKQEGDSIGGVVTGVIRNVPVGLGAPVFDKLTADLAKAMLSINAVKGFEIGSGFAGVELRGSQHNDIFIVEDGKISTNTNNAGGTLGGISSGETIYFRVAFKAVSTIAKEQESIDINNNKIKFTAKGRHDPCVVARAVPVVEAMAALVIIDHYLRAKAYSIS
jgi:chorismate synthase